jgi:hypothetical protein
LDSFKFDPISPKWHPSFDLETVKDIPLSPLPIKKRESYLDVLKRRNSIYATPTKQKSETVVSSPEGSVVKDDYKVEDLKTPPPTPLESGKPISKAKALLERVYQWFNKRSVKSND